MNCLVKQFAICLGVVAILLLNVMEVFSVGGGALLDIITLVLDGMLLSDWMVWCGGCCVPWSFDARLCVDTFGVERSVTHHSISQL